MRERDKNLIVRRHQLLKKSKKDARKNQCFSKKIGVREEKKNLKENFFILMENNNNNNNLEQENQNQQQILPPHPNESPLSHEWFRYRLEEFIRRCDATVNQIVHGNHKNRASDFFSNDDDDNDENNNADPAFSFPSTV